MPDDPHPGDSEIRKNPSFSEFGGHWVLHARTWRHEYRDCLTVPFCPASVATAIPHLIKAVTGRAISYETASNVGLHAVKFLNAMHAQLALVASLMEDVWRLPSS